MPALISYTCVICQKVDRPLSYTCSKCQPSSITHLEQVKRHRFPLDILLPNASNSKLHVCQSQQIKNPYLYLCQMPALLCCISAFYMQIHRTFNYTSVKCQNSSITHVPYNSIYKYPIFIFVPTASTLLLSI